MWKGSLNSDGQQFNQYQQDEQSPIASIHLTLICFETGTKYAGVKSVNGILTVIHVSGNYK